MAILSISRKVFLDIFFETIKVQKHLTPITESYVGNELKREYEVNKKPTWTEAQMMDFFRYHNQLTSLQRLLLWSPANSNLMTCLNWPGDLAIEPLTCYHGKSECKK